MPTIFGTQTQNYTRDWAYR